MSISRIKPTWVLTAIAVLCACLYIGERLYVTPAEAVDNTLERALTALTNEQVDQLNQLLHNSLFETPPPQPVQSFLPQASRSRNQWTRQQFKNGLQEVYKRISIDRYVVMKQDITVRDRRATVSLQVLVFYQERSEQETDKTGRLPNKFLSSWTIELRKNDGAWNIDKLTYGT